MSQTAAPLRIDIVSDVVCPWCIVGYRQLEEALEATGTEFEVFWHPFELNPAMPAEGQNLAEHLAQKYGSTPEQSRENRVRLTQVGDALGFAFQFSEDSRMVNTFDAHQIIHWAETKQRAHEMKQALFAAHFTEGRDVSDRGVLADVAQALGLDRDEAVAVLTDQRFAAVVRAGEAFWQKQGITGVPAVVFDQKHLVTGAQGVENYTHMLGQLAQMRAEAAV